MSEAKRRGLGGGPVVEPQSGSSGNPTTPQPPPTGVGGGVKTVQTLVVPKEKIAASGDYNLSMDRYREAVLNAKQAWPMAKIGDLCEVLDSLRKPVRKDERQIGRYPYYGATGIVDYVDQYLFDEKLVLVGEDGAKWEPGDGTAFIANDRYWVNNHAHVLRPNRNLIYDEILVEILNSMDLTRYVTGITVPKLTQEKLRAIEIPLPPLPVQEALVTELERYRKMIEGARAILANYKPEIEIDPKWEMRELGEVANFINGRAYKQDELLNEGKYTVLRVGNFFSNDSWYYSDLELPDDKYCDNGDLLYAWSASFGPRIWQGGKVIYHYHIWKVIPDTNYVLKDYLFYLLDIDKEKIKADKGIGSTMTHVTKESMEKRLLPIPPLTEQQTIVARLEAERAEMGMLKGLIVRMESKIKGKVAGLWGE
jgi:type I restriction enzyme S subunit